MKDTLMAFLCGFAIVALTLTLIVASAALRLAIYAAALFVIYWVGVESGLIPPMPWW